MITITSQGFIRVVKNGQIVSQHREAKDALESAVNAGGTCSIEFPSWLVQDVVTAKNPTVNCKVSVVSHLQKIVFGDVEEEVWQLDAGHFVPAKMVPQIIHPRPDSEMGASARAARCPSDIQWEIPVVVQGGAWPFKYELVTGPSGMAMRRETLPSDWLTNGAQGYGILRWSTPTVGSHPVTVRVTDQDGTIVTRSWTLECIDRENTTYFLFLDATNGADGNSGSYSSPRQTLGTGLYTGVGGKSNTTWQGRQVFFRAGTYTTIVNTGATEQMDFTTSKPTVYVGYPGESVTIDCTAAIVDFEAVNGGGDLCWTNVTWTNPEHQSDELKMFIRTAAGNCNRRIFYNNTYEGGGDTPSADGNNSCCVFNRGQSSPTLDHYTADVHCTYNDCDNMDFILIYDTHNSVCEFNTITGGYGGSHNPSWGFFLKGNDIQTYTIRANRAIDGTITRPTFRTTLPNPFVKGDIEICWNNFKNTATSGNGQGCVSIGEGDTQGTLPWGPVWSYRNNYRQATLITVFAYDSGGPITFENDVIEHDGTDTDGITTSGSSLAPTLTDLAEGTAMVDSTTNLLTGAARTTYLGTHGCEVA